MSEFKIYLAGGMTGMSWEDQNKWRENLKFQINYKNESHGYNRKLRIINPCDYYNFEQKRHQKEEEIMNYDLWHVRNSNLIIVNLNNPNSIGTAMELALAREYKIPVVALLEWNPEKDKEKYPSFEDKIQTIHPWIRICCDRFEPNMYTLADFISDFYLK